MEGDGCWMLLVFFFFFKCWFAVFSELSPRCSLRGRVRVHELFSAPDKHVGS